MFPSIGVTSRESTPHNPSGHRHTWLYWELSFLWLHVLLIGKRVWWLRSKGEARPEKGLAWPNPIAHGHFLKIKIWFLFIIMCMSLSVFVYFSVSPSLCVSLCLCLSVSPSFLSTFFLCLESGGFRRLSSWLPLMCGHVCKDACKGQSGRAGVEGEPPDRCWELTLGPLDEQKYVLLTAEPILQLHKWTVCTVLFCFFL